VSAWYWLIYRVPDRQSLLQGFIRVCVVHIRARFGGQPCQGCATFSVLAHPTIWLSYELD